MRRVGPPTALVLRGEAGGRDGEGVDPCGPLDDALRESRLERRVGLFTSPDEEHAAARAEMGLRRVDPGEPVEVVETPAESGRVVAKAFWADDLELVTKFLG